MNIQGNFKPGKSGRKLVSTQSIRAKITYSRIIILTSSSLSMLKRCLNLWTFFTTDQIIKTCPGCDFPLCFPHELLISLRRGCQLCLKLWVFSLFSVFLRACPPVSSVFSGFHRVLRFPPCSPVSSYIGKADRMGYRKGQLGPIQLEKLMIIRCKHR